MSVETYGDQINIAKASFDKATKSAGQLTEETKKLGRTAEPIAQIYRDTATSIRSSFRDTFRDVFDNGIDGFKSFGDRILNVFKNMLADMATLAIARPVIIPMVSAMGGALGVSGPAQAATVGQLGGASAGISTMGMAAGAGISTMGMFGSGMSAGLQGGFGAASAIGANTTMSTTIGAYVGAALPWIAGALLVNSLTDGALFGTSWKTKQSGLDLDFSGGIFSGQSFREQSRQRALFGGKQTRTQFSALDAELVSQIQGTFDQITDNFRDMGQTLGRDADAVLANFTTSAQLSLQGLSESEISDRINEWVQDVSDQMAAQILPGIEAFKRQGEALTETLTRLAQTVNTVTELNQTIDNTIAMTAASSNVVANYVTRMSDVNTSIENTLQAIANTDDISARVNLEAQLATSIGDRYQLEQAMIGVSNGAMDGYLVRMGDINTSITNLINDIANTDDITERVGLESQLAASISDRYQLEQIMISASSQAMTGFRITLNGMNASIAGLINDIANTDDITERVGLESQLMGLIKERYDMELGLLNDMASTVTEMINNIAGLRGAINQDITAISGSGTVSTAAEIQTGLEAIVPPQVASLDDHNALIAKSEELQRQIVNETKGINDRNLAIDQQVLSDSDKFSLAVWDRENFIKQIRRNISQTMDGLSTYIAQQSKLVEEVNADPTLIGLGLDRDLSLTIAEQETMINYLFSGVRKAAAQFLLNELIVSDLEQQNTTARDNISTLTGEQLIVDNQATQALIDFNAALEAFTLTATDQIDTLRDLREATLEYYQAQKALDGAMTNAAANIGATLERLRLNALTPGARLADLTAQFGSLSTQASTADGYDLVSLSERLNALVDPLLGEASNLYASGAGYQDIYQQITDTLSNVQTRLTELAPQGYEQTSIGLLTGIDTLLDQLNNELSAAEQAIVSAIDNTGLATIGQLDAIRLLLDGEADRITGLEPAGIAAAQALVNAAPANTTAAVDGSHADGLSRVPYDGYVAQLHRDESVIDARTMAGMRRYGINGGDNSKLLPVLQRIEKAISAAGGDLLIKVVTADGTVIKEQVISDIKRRSKRGETVVHAAGVA